MSIKPNPPLNFALALFPGFQLLDVAGPLDILNLLSITHEPTKDLSLTIIASTLDPVPTKPIPPTDAGTGQPKWTFPDWPTNTSFSESFVPNTTFDSYLTALENNTLSNSPDSQNKPIDVLLIPGGIGTRISRKTTSTNQTASNVADLMSFTKKIAPHIRHSIITICTGSDVLAQTGLLNSRRATSNMSRFNDVAARSPAVKWLKARRWVRSSPTETKTPAQDHAGTGTDTDTDTDTDTNTAVFHGDIWTSAGISAGIDVTFAFVAEHYGGMAVARDIATKLEYEWREIGEGEIDPMYGYTEK